MPFPIVIVVAGLIGYFGGRAGLPAFLAGGGHGKVGDRQLADADLLLGEETPAHARPNLRWSLSIAAVFLALWLVPVARSILGLGGDNVFTKIAIFFSQMAVVTFGGAYAVLAYVAQQAVDHYHWVTAGEMLDGLGMAETTPGPLIMVTQFVGFLAAWREPGGMPPLLAATLGGLLTTWVTFVPCFLWIFFGAPFVEALRGQQGAGRGARRHHRRRGRRDPEPRGVVRAARAVRQARAGALAGRFRRRAGPELGRPAVARAVARRGGGDLPLQVRDDPRPAGELAGGRGLLHRWRLACKVAVRHG